MQDKSKRDCLAKAKNIAILGISQDSTKASHQVGEYLIAQDFNIIPIHPKATEILGKKVYSSLQDAFSDTVIKECGGIDILNVFRKSEALLGIANEVIALKNKPKCVWVQLGLENQEAKRLLEEYGILYFENLCIKIEHQRLFG
ncbi:MAG: CoA-binding protein [Helicobacter sp.]|nr:CoA-binding protein [Helicobacter sp.]